MDSQKKQALVIAMRTLAASPKSRAEITQKLKDKGIPSPVIEEALAELESQGILSDKAYAQNLIAKFTHGKPSGSRKIKFELKRHGISGKDSEEALAGLDPEEERARAKELAETRWERFKTADPEKRKKRVFDFLMRRGFDYQTVREVIEELETGMDTNA